MKTATKRLLLPFVLICLIHGMARAACIGGFNNVYWPSTEDGSNGAWGQRFSDGNQGGGNKTNSNDVRCVRRD